MNAQAYFSKIADVPKVTRANFRDAYRGLKHNWRCWRLVVKPTQNRAVKCAYFGRYGVVLPPLEEGDDSVYVVSLRLGKSYGDAIRLMNKMRTDYQAGLFTIEDPE